MILFDLICSGQHRFEAWFGSSDSYAEQQQRRLIPCPICGDTDVAKAVMAPRVGRKGNQGAAVSSGARGDGPQKVPAPAPQEGAPVATAMAGMAPSDAVRAMLARIASEQAEALPRSKWVGRDFAPAARAMHEGRADSELIHGQVSPDEARALHEDGVAAMPLLVPFVPPESAN